jgi:site-specific DNA-methyltransferase (adenine-specific)
METNKLYLGDCKEVLKTLPDESIDCILTDPPYQLSSITKRFGKEGSAPAQRGFMGKTWDVLPPVETWKECLRVMKSGAFAFIMTTPRQDSLCQILNDLTQAGFVMGFSSLYWVFASGFPKAMNISKMVDKKLGIEVKEGVGFRTAGYDGRPVMGDATPQGEERDAMRHKPVSLQAKALDGSYGGFQAKPALEIILVCMKPLSEKTFIEQALKRIGEEQKILEEIKLITKNKYGVDIEWE